MPKCRFNLAKPAYFTYPPLLIGLFPIGSWVKLSKMPEKAYLAYPPMWNRSFYIRLNEGQKFRN